MRTINILLFLLFLNCADSWCFTLYLKDGRQVDGTWIAESQEMVVIKDKTGVVQSYKKSDMDMKAMAKSRMPLYDFTNIKRSEPKQPPETVTVNRVGQPTTIQPLEPPKLQTPNVPKVSSKRWFLEAGYSNVYENNIHHDEEDIVRSVGVVASLNGRFRNRPTNPNFLLRYEIGLHEYSNTDVWDRVSHNFRAGHLIYLGKKFVLENNGEIALNGSSEDRELGDQYGYRPVLNYYLTRSTQLEVFGAYRYRKFDTGFTAINRYAGAGFIQELGHHQIDGYYRYEYNNSENPLNDRYISTYNAGYTMPLFADVKASFTARLRATRYVSRFARIDVEDGPDIKFLRRDRKWNFKLAVAVPLFHKFELVPEYEYENRTSNDPEKKYDAHGASLALVYSLW